MVPTNYLRFVERDLGIGDRHIDTNGNVIRTVKKVRMLQQWWEDRSCDVYLKGTPSGSPGVWKDVQVENEGA